MYIGHLVNGFFTAFTHRSLEKIEWNHIGWVETNISTFSGGMFKIETTGNWVGQLYYYVQMKIIKFYWT